MIAFTSKQIGFSVGSATQRAEMQSPLFGGNTAIHSPKRALRYLVAHCPQG
jgi:hypothetical protein